MDSKLLMVVGVIALVIVLFIVWYVVTYNGLVALETTVDEKWAQVENQYQRRADLIPNLVSTVKGYAAHEEELFLEVTEMRSQWTTAVGSGDVESEISAAKGLDSAISRLLMVAESYPELKASENFLALQAQLEGTENRIAVERGRYNEAVRDFNIRIRSIPDSFVASGMGLEKKAYFEADAGTDEVPEVEF